MATIKTGHATLHKLAQALGLDGRYVRRLVVDVAVDSVVKVYIQAFGTEEDIAAVGDLLTADVPLTIVPCKRVGVDRDGFVIHEKA